MKHVLFTLTVLFILAIPALFIADWTPVFHNGVDAVTGASLEVPDSPSGNFYILMNRKYRNGTENEWKNFFTEKPVGVIFEDVSCQVLAADVTGKQLAERYQARLAENQMNLRAEPNSLLFSAKVENAYFDTAIVSKEIAEVCNITEVFRNPDILVIPIQSES